jgi:hypothetical protein
LFIYQHADGITYFVLYVVDIVLIALSPLFSMSLL